MPHATFVHLRVHSAFSLLAGMMHVEDVVALARGAKMPAVAVTDTDNLFGALEFSMAAAPAGVQPIIGCDLGFARETGEVRASRPNAVETPARLVLLVQNDTGYRNLLKLIDIAYERHRAAGHPTITLGHLTTHNEGLIALTGSDGPVGRLLAESQSDAAERMLLDLAQALPERLYIEISRHGMPAEAATEAPLLDFAYRHNLPLVATNQAFFAKPEDYEAHDALRCVAEGGFVSQADRRRLTADYRFRSADEMRKLFADLPEAIDNTLVVAQRCAFRLEPRQPILPAFPTTSGRTEVDELKALAEAGLDKRLVDHVYGEGLAADARETTARPYRERLEYELSIIHRMGFDGYFLIVADFVRWAKGEGIPVGPGRGSGAGSVASWALGITDLDPLRFGLLFERFLNPERVSMPDFDIDFCRDRRDEVIGYVQQKYGVDRVAQIITFGTLQARAVIRDTGRVLELPYGQVDRVAKLIPNNPANPVTLDQAIKGDAQFKTLIDTDPAVGRLIVIARPLEGLYRHASTHAAGVVIGDRPLNELIPLYRDPRSDILVTGFSMKFAEMAGLVKFDFLGLKTLTLLAAAEKLLASRGIHFDPSRLPLDDKPTFEMLARADSTGVFQLESAGMRDVLRRLKPDTFEDIIAVVALFRPGPMANIPSYIKRKHGEEEPDYLYPTLERILKETFGIMIYQEQVMQIAQELAGFSLGSADLLRRAMGKKIKEEMEEQREVFVSGAAARGVPKQRAAQIFEQVAKFAGYGFNKSHAAAYALVAYQTAYLKANYPVEFFAASMTSEIGNTDKINGFRQELSRLDIPLLGPDVNFSNAAFTVGEDEKGRPGIRYGLAAIRNLGEGAVETLVQERTANGPFKDMVDFAHRLDPHAFNKRQLENLARAGAFSGFTSNRKQVFDSIDALWRQAGARDRDAKASQMGLFGAAESGARPLQLAVTEDWTPVERLKQEFDALGFYLSAHPLDAYERALKRLKVRRSAEVIEEGRPGPVVLAGTVIAKRERTSGRGNRYAFVQMSDTSGAFEVTMFSEQLLACRDSLEIGNSLLVRANAQFEGEVVRFTTISAEPLQRVASDLTPGVVIAIDTPEPLARLRDTIGPANGGNGALVKLLSRLDEGTEVELELPGRYRITPETLLALKVMPGIRSVTEL
ncbi:MAG: DNA polymerase III subunit alpha [Rhodospirillales bacterium]|nr:DNA polymerase III subunit alpha [Rhodospirillales bacterium]